MIELNDDQRKVLAGGGSVRVFEDGQEYVLLRADVYDRMTDDENLSDEELDRLAKETEEMLNQDPS